MSNHNAIRRTYLESGVVFDVTPPAFRAVYTAEWASRYATQIRKSTLEDWVKLTRMMNIISAYKRGEKIDELEQALASSFVVNRASAGTGSMMHPGGSSTLPLLNPSAPELAEQFRVYSWKCARAAVERPLFERAITFDSTDLGWRQPAREIQRVHREVRHPIDPNVFDPGLRPSRAGQQALLDYFDMYAFARERSAREIRLDEQVRRHARGIIEALGWVSPPTNYVPTSTEITGIHVPIGGDQDGALPAPLVA